MAFLMQVLTMVAKIFIPLALQELMDYLKDGKDLRDWKNSEWAKIEAAANKYKQELAKAGDDEQAQKDAFDKLMSGRG